MAHALRLLRSTRPDAFDEVRQGGAVACFALPYDHDLTPGPLQGGAVALVALRVTGELRLPKLQAGFRQARGRAPRVTMPEASVDEQGDATAWKH